MHNINKPLVSVIIPTYNRMEFLYDCINSVINQSYDNLEIIVIDDGSTDDSQEVINQFLYDIKYIYQSNSGAASARNNGIKNASGKYIAFLDSDDEFYPDKINKQVEYLESNPDFVLVYTNIVYKTPTGKIVSSNHNNSYFKSGYIFSDVILANVLCLIGTWLIKKECFDVVGCLDPEFLMAEDRDIAIRVASKYKIHGMSDPLLINSAHETERVSVRSGKDSEYYWTLLTDKILDEFGDIINKHIRKKFISKYKYLSGFRYLRDNNFVKARQLLLQSIINYPFNTLAYKYLFISIFHKPIFKIFKNNI